MVPRRLNNLTWQQSFRPAPALFLSMAFLASLTGCGRSDEGPGGVTRSEQKALDDAAEMVEQKQLNPSTIPPAPAVAPAPVASQSN